MRHGCLLLLLGILSACTIGGAPPAPDPARSTEDTAAVMVWPPPPEQARIEFVRQFSTAEDLDLSRPFGRKLRSWLAGSDDRQMLRPYAIAGSQDLLVIADPDAAIVHLFDIQAKKYRILTRASKKQNFRSPIGVALGAEWLYVADSVLKRVFVFDRKLKLRHTIEGFDRPTGLAFAQQIQRLYVADTAAHKIRVFSPEGEEVMTIGERGTLNVQFNYPSHIAVAGNRLLVNDTLNFRIQLLSLDGEYLGGFGKHGVGSGSFDQSKGVVADPDGHIYVADARANWLQIFSPAGELLLVLGSGGDTPGAFNMPAGLAFVDNTLYVADSFNRRIQVFRYLPEEP